jgi:transcriptional regulator with XRE-family HTH domain
VAESWSSVARRVARNVRERRLERNWSQSRLAIKSGLSLRRVQQIEAGGPDANPSLRAVHQIARALGTTAVALLGEEASPAGRERATKGR